MIAQLNKIWHVWACVCVCDHMPLMAMPVTRSVAVMQVLRFNCNYAGGTFYYSYVGGSFSCNYAGDCFVAIRQLEVSAALMHAGYSFQSEYVGDNFYCNYAGGSLCYNYADCNFCSTLCM